MYSDKNLGMKEKAKGNRKVKKTTYIIWKRLPYKKGCFTKNITKIKKKRKKELI